MRIASLPLANDNDDDHLFVVTSDDDGGDRNDDNGRVPSSSLPSCLTISIGDDPGIRTRPVPHLFILAVIYHLFTGDEPASCRCGLV